MTTSACTVDAAYASAQGAGAFHRTALEAESAHAAIRNEILQHEALRTAMTSAVAQRATFIASMGNIGDGLVQLGTFDLFAEFGLAPRVQGLWTSPPDGQKLAVIGGGGGWVEGFWEKTARAMRPFLEGGGEIILLPSSVSGFEQYFAQYARQVTIFARERVSFDRLNAVAELHGRVHLCHDLAFALDPTTFSELRRMQGSGELSLFRSDAEGCRTELPPSNIDIALSRNGDIWHSREACLQPVMAVARMMSHFEHVRTDRLHMTALAAMLGRRVTMSRNSYFKNQAVFESSLCRFKNVTLAEEENSGPARPIPSRVGSGQVMPGDASPAASGRAQVQGQTGSANPESMRNELVALARLRREWFEPELCRLQQAVREHERTRKDLYDQLQEQRRRSLHYAADAAAKQNEIASQQQEILKLHARLKHLQQFELKLKQQVKISAKLQRQLARYRSQLAAIQGSRWYKAWRIYLKSYSLPVLGGVLRRLRRAVGILVRARHRP
ncbi:polysaccharide pyruvyl transferase family protein [Microvirga aerilata]|uniref:polysaccharide pyruvyl transferase family protein n=1 Tax=Microvirga aerilata TaxID=670292 RepID=UPI0019212C37|nr:polysaccharide pyruvyl transferase family protein [Microvirga aerilata]